MKILLIMDPGLPVPPVLYGGIERIVYLLAEEYIKLGHEVTLLAGPGSYCTGETIHYGENNAERSKMKVYKEILFVWKYLFHNKSNFDLIHNFGRLIYLLPVINHSIKKIMSYQRYITNGNIKVINKLWNRNLKFTACSNHCMSTGDRAGEWETVYNAIDFSIYQPNDSIADDAPLMFLGRLDRIKGVHIAIEVALATGNQLIIAGNIPHTQDNFNYFKTEIEPKFDDKQIKYMGALNDAEKNIWLSKAKALLFPIEWDEPFGIVMIEAMACGTPVIAFKRGSVQEVVDEKITGYITNSTGEMISAIDRIQQIDRLECRKRSFNRFNINKIANDYLNLFHTDLNYTELNV